MGRILWLASYPKSGNTWLRVFLANLFKAGGGAHDVNRIGEATLAEPVTAGFARLDPRPWQDWSQADIARMRPQVQAGIAALGEGAVPVKTHSAFVNVGGVAAINMAVTGGAVYIVRDPRDVAVSYAHHLGMTIDQILEIMAHDMFRTPTNDDNVSEVMGSWSQHVASWTTNRSAMLHVMRYEDMLADAETAFLALARFMRVAADEAVVRAAVANAAFDKVAAMEAASGFIERTPAQQRFFRAGRAGQWREAMTLAQAEAVVAVHGEQMAKFGYLGEEFGK